MTMIALNLLVKEGAGVLNRITKIILEHKGNITDIDVTGKRKERVMIYVEIEDIKESEKLIKQLSALDSVFKATEVVPLKAACDKKIVVLGGGAQLADIAKGAINEADRHNLRGERISVEVIPTVGEEELEKAIKAAGNMTKTEAVVLGGSLMGGKITDAVKEIREKGLIVISTNMAGSAPKECDLVVTEPVQAGVMSVTAIADTASFEIEKQRKRVY